MPKALWEFCQKGVRVCLPERDRSRNTYICASIGSGKSELVKLLIHAYVVQPETAVVLLDPSGRTANECRFHELGDRLVWVDPNLSESHTPTINPFEVRGFRSARQERRVKDVHTQEVVGVIEQMLGSAVTDNMRAVLSYAIRALLDVPGATFETLEELMLGNREVHERCKASSSESASRFFRQTFSNQSYSVSRNAIATKLQATVLISDTFKHLTCGPTTVNLEELIEQRKVIVFRMTKGSTGGQVMLAFSRLVMAMLLSIALRRDEVEDESTLTPVHCFIEEAQNYLVPSLFTALAETRKFRFMQTLVQPSPFLGMTRDEQTLLLQTTGLRFIGNCESDAFGDARKLERGQFYMMRGQQTITMRAFTHLLGTQHNLSSAEWEIERRRQVGLYYRPIQAQAEQKRSSWERE